MSNTTLSGLVLVLLLVGQCIGWWSLTDTEFAALGILMFVADGAMALEKIAKNTTPKV